MYLRSSGGKGHAKTKRTSSQATGDPRGNVVTGGGVAPFHGLLLALARVWGDAFAAVEALLGADGYRAVVALPAPLTRTRVGQRAVPVVLARLRAERNTAVVTAAETEKEV